MSHREREVFQTEGAMKEKERKKEKKREKNPQQQQKRPLFFETLASVRNTEDAIISRGVAYKCVMGCTYS